MPTRGSSHRDTPERHVPSPLSVSFRFYAQLNDFLPIEARGTLIERAYLVAPSVKDAIEALGIPHVEVALVLVGGRPATFEQRLASGDRVVVYPVFTSLELGALGCLSPPALCAPRFVADVHLRKLSRLLRLLGFDVLHAPTYSNQELVAISIHEERILLTRDRMRLKCGRLTRGYWVRSVIPRVQAAEILRRFDLTGRVSPYTRCPRCNGVLRRVDKRDVIARIPPKTAAWLDDYVECVSCRRLYWQGTHTRRIHATLEEILRLAGG
jgi:uncharacterized protein